MAIELRKPCEHGLFYECGGAREPSLAEVIEWLREHDGINYEAAEAIWNNFIDLLGERLGTFFVGREELPALARKAVDAALGGER